MKGMRALVAAALCLFVSACSRGSDYPVIGESPVRYLQERESRVETVLAWTDAGLRRATVVSINPRSGLGQVSDTALQGLKDRAAGRQGGEAVGGPQTSVGADNYLAAAASLGLVRNVHWVLPFRYFSDMTVAKSRIDAFLRSPAVGFSDAEVGGMLMDQGCLSGPVRGVQLAVCGFSTLHLIPEPVVLDLGVDFLPVMAGEYGVNKLGAIKMLMDALALRKLRAQRVDVTYGIRDGRTRPIHRFLGEEAAALLRDPAMLWADPPPLWTARDLAENMFSGGEGAKVLVSIDEALRTFPGDPALVMLQAAAMTRTGQGRAALEMAVGLCASRKDYCDGPAYLAYLAGLRGDRNLQERIRGRVSELGLPWNAAPHYEASGGGLPGGY